MNAATADQARVRLPPPARQALLTAHIVVAVGLLGDSAGFLAVAIRAASTDDPHLAAASYELLEMFSLVFGIPLSFAALLTGITLGISSAWGILRHLWTTAKLALIISVILVGALVINGALEESLSGSGDADTALIAAAAYDVLALTPATGLAVYKPSRRRKPVP
jgi:Predicted integral membrane protein (DUF2269)